jgi:N-acetylglutamate synthase-like GNAT family acetyltransferase
MDNASVIEASEGKSIQGAFLVAVSPDLFAEFGFKRAD